MDTEDINKLRSELIEKIAETGGRIEAKIDMLITQIQKNQGYGQATVPNSSALLSLTTKQHAALQMLLGGKSNRDISERFGVSENTSKVYVRGIAAKLGVNTRTQIVLRATPLLDAISDEEYLLVSGGIPKTWDRDYSAPDKYAGLYRH